MTLYYIMLQVLAFISWEQNGYIQTQRQAISLWMQVSKVMNRVWDRDRQTQRHAISVWMQIRKIISPGRSKHAHTQRHAMFVWMQLLAVLDRKLDRYTQTQKHAVSLWMQVSPVVPSTSYIYKDAKARGVYLRSVRALITQEWYKYTETEMNAIRLNASTNSAHVGAR